MNPLRWKDLYFDKYTSIALGNFDGVHAGHQALISKTVELAREKNLVPAVLTFHPHPVKVLKGASSHLTLTPLKEKVRLIRLYGIEKIFILEFNEELYHLTPEEFVEEVLIKRLRCKALVVGDNFRFGKGRSGDIVILRRLSKIYDFTFFPYPQVHIDGMPVSSTRIRRMLREGRVEEAFKMLKRPYKIIGKVVEGKGRGKALGFPTANLKCYNGVLPRNGVYACFAEVRGAMWRSVVNVGTVPTFGGSTVTVEAYIMDFEEDIYGKEMALYLIRRLRDERKFDSIDELIDAIRRDCIFGKGFLQWERFCVGLLPFWYVS